jgi:TctA family transporter
MDLVLLALAIAFVLVGCGTGMLTGLVPGIHVNTVALLLLTSYPLLADGIGQLCACLGVAEGNAPMLVAVLIVAATVVHSFIDFIPSTFLGAPDESNALSVLPSHRLLLAGKGLQAVQAAAMGSLVGALVSLLFIPVLFVIMSSGLALETSMDLLVPFLLIAVSCVLILSEARGGHLRASIDARQGSVDPSSGGICLLRMVPVEGEPAVVSGRVLQAGRKRSIIHGVQGDWQVLHRRPLPSGFITVRGIWKVVRAWWEKPLWALFVFLISGLLGFTAMNARLPFSDLFHGWGQSILFPLLAGLFGIPALLLALSARPIPPQDAVEKEEANGGAALQGAVGGFLAGWFPGITSTSGTVMLTALARRGRSRDRDAEAKRFIVMVSSVGTSSAVFSIAALAISGKGRTGAMLAVKQLLGSEGLQALASFPSLSLALVMLAVLIASVLGFCATTGIASLFVRKMAGADLRPFNLAILAFVTVLAFLFTGLPGLLLLAVAVLVGLLPPRIGIGRVHLTGSLLLPLILFFLGLRLPMLDWLGG